MKAAGWVDPVKPGGRRERKIAVLLGEMVGREKSSQQNGGMKHAEKYQDRAELASPAHSHLTLIRGSIRYRSRSPARFPETRKMVDIMTTPSTSAKSRAMMASRNSGPSPGHPMITSMRRDALSKVPSEKPNSEISGLSAAGSKWRNSRRRRGMP